MAIADIDGKGLEELAKELGATYKESNVLAVVTDVSRLDEVVKLRERVYEAWGEVNCFVFLRVVSCLLFSCTRSLCYSIMPRWQM